MNQLKFVQPEIFFSSSHFLKKSGCVDSVRAGVDHFKHGRHVEAMNEYNKALEIDTSNVEALVARGAL